MNEYDRYADNLVGVLGLPAAVLDNTGRVVSCNDGFNAALPRTASCFRGTYLPDVLDTISESEFLGCLSSSADGTADMRIEVPSGHFRLSIDRLANSDGGYISLCQLTHDLEMDSARLQFLLEHLDQGVWNYDLVKDRFSVTAAWRRIRNIHTDFDVFSDEVQDPGWWLKNIHDDDRDHVANAFNSLVTGDKNSVNMQYRYRTAEDQFCWILCHAKVMLRGESGRPILLVGMDTDITSIKDGEIEQLELVSKLQLAIEVSGMGVWEYDSATAKVFWDDTMLEIFGQTNSLNNRPDDLWETYLHPDDREATVAAADLALKEHRDFRADYRIVRPDGEVRYIRSASRFIAVSGTSGKALGVNIDVTEDYARAEELERARQLLEHDSRHDALTGLANRRLLDEHTTALIERLGPTDEFAVLHIDLDHFKQVNDTLGHAAGDKVLVRVAETLQALVADDGLVCRNGGDEFVVVIEKFEGEKALRALCQTMISQMAEPMIMQGRVRSIGLSIGCVISSGDVGDAGEVFINADVALYAAKSAGRSCYKMFAPGLRSVSQVDVTTYHDLAGAMDAGQVICYFQPQFDTKTLAVVGAEALVRWECPTRGVVLPDQFIPAAQATGLCGRLDACVLDFVLEKQTAWSKAGLEVPTVALNVSIDRLMEQDLIEQITAKLKPHHSISFELLETAFLDQRTHELDRVLANIRKAGIRIDLDDFGSGHSSIVALQSVQPDRVKVDRMLIAPLCDNPAQIHILEALVQVARLENCGVVVEGIETQEQLDAVLGLECEVVQGFLLGRPMSDETFADTLPRAFNSGSKRA